MKRTYIHIIILAAALLSLASCLSVEPPVPAPSDRIPVYFEACKTQYAPGTRANVDPTTGTISWIAGHDAVAVYAGSGYVSATIESGDFISLSGSAGTRARYAVYPYESRDVSNTGSPTLKVLYPTSYDLTGRTTASYCRLPMVAANTPGGALDFYNVGALLHFSFSSVPAGTDKIRLTFTGVNPTGYFTVSNPGTATATTNLSGGTSTGNVITFDVDYAEDIELNVPIPCGNYSALTQVAVECLSSLNAVLKTINVAGSTLSLGTVTRGKGRKAPVVIQEASFGGLMISPGNLSHDGSTFVMTDDYWNPAGFDSSSSGSGYPSGTNSGSYTFNIYELGYYFDSDGYGYDPITKDIDNAGNLISYGGYDDWRLPTSDEWRILFSTNPLVRPGSTVNGISNVSYLRVNQLQGTTVQGQNDSSGILLFPDDGTYNNSGILNGSVTLSPSNGSASSYITLTNTTLDELLADGCVYLPCLSPDSYYRGHEAQYASATHNNTKYSYFECLHFGNSDGWFGPVIGNSYNYGLSYTSSSYFVRLVRNN